MAAQQTHFSVDLSTKNEAPVSCRFCRQIIAPGEKRQGFENTRSNNWHYACEKCMPILLDMQQKQSQRLVFLILPRAHCLNCL